MTRRKTPPLPSAPVILCPFILHPDTVLTLEQARQALGLARSSLKSEVRAGRLRVARRAGRYFTCGAWLAEWIREGEFVAYRSRRPDAA